jgi:hypothetical protein
MPGIVRGTFGEAVHVYAPPLLLKPYGEDFALPCNGRRRRNGIGFDLDPGFHEMIESRNM